MKILSLYRKQIPFTKGIKEPYAPYIATSLTMTPDGAIKGFVCRSTNDKSINIEWLKLSEELSIKSNGKISPFKKAFGNI